MKIRTLFLLCFIFFFYQFFNTTIAQTYSEIWLLEDTVGDYWEIAILDKYKRIASDWKPSNPINTWPMTIHEAQNCLNSFMKTRDKISKSTRPIDDLGCTANKQQRNVRIDNLPKKNDKHMIDYYSYLREIVKYDRYEIIPIDKRGNQWTFIFHFYSAGRGGYAAVFSTEGQSNPIVISIAKRKSR